MAVVVITRGDINERYFFRSSTDGVWAGRRVSRTGFVFSCDCFTDEAVSIPS